MTVFSNGFHFSALAVMLLLLESCGGGGGGGSAEISPPSTSQPPSSGQPSGSGEDGICASAGGPYTLVTPGLSWQKSTPEEQGLCSTDIQEALDYAFATGNDTGAVVVIRNGYVVAERYDSSKSPDDLVTSWSVAKSITSALVGSAVAKGEIKGMDQPLSDFIPAWQGTPKADITVAHLLTVRTALELIGDPDGDGIPDGADLYGADDQLAMALDRPLVGKPGEALYVYSNADVMIAGELIQAATGISASEYLPVAFGDATGFKGEWWTDTQGHTLTYCCMDATPLDFARFGLLMARDGRWNGHQVISNAWISESTVRARGGTYGYFWWPAVAGGFAALGVQGQMIAIYPEDDLVILRFGNYRRNGDGSSIRTLNNYHVTKKPENFEANTFITLVREALPPAPAIAANSAPVAAVSPDQVVEVQSRVTLWAGGSADADNDRTALDWQLVDAPANSKALIEGIGDTVYLTPDFPGTYRVNLTLSDGQAMSNTAATTIEVVANRNLLVTGTAEGQWPSYAGNLSSNKYSPLDQITAENISQLQVVWRWRSPDNDITVAQNSVFESTPLMVDGILYTSTSFSQVAAIHAATGKTLWTYDPQAYQFARPPNNGFLHRGVSYHEDRQGKKIHMPTGDARLIALDAVTGKPIEGFGSLGNGSVDLLTGIPRLNQSTVRLGNAHNQPDVPDLVGVVTQVGNSSPGIVCRNVLVLGAQVHDGEVLPPSPPGDVRGFDLNTGELLWTFHTVPRAGEFGIETWGNNSWQTNGNTNVWAPISADEELGMVYLPVSCPTNNYYGGRRPGDNLFANSVVALDCETGERQWHYQTVHHDIWDYDLPAAPNLIDIVVEDKPVKALAQVSKQGFVYVLDRETGEPVWPIVETPVPASTVPGEITSPTQPIPTKPPPFVSQGVVRADFIDPS